MFDPPIGWKLSKAYEKELTQDVCLLFLIHKSESMILNIVVTLMKTPHQTDTFLTKLRT